MLFYIIDNFSASNGVVKSNYMYLNYKVQKGAEYYFSFTFNFPNNFKRYSIGVMR